MTKKVVTFDFSTDMQRQLEDNSIDAQPVRSPQSSSKKKPAPRPKQRKNAQEPSSIDRAEPAETEKPKPAETKKAQSVEPAPPQMLRIAVRIGFRDATLESEIENIAKASNVPKKRVRANLVKKAVQKLKDPQKIGALKVGEDTTAAIESYATTVSLESDKVEIIHKKIDPYGLAPASTSLRRAIEQLLTDES